MNAAPRAGRVRVLGERVVARIAAGEAIGRPRNAVKELLDNALDSGASHIQIEIAAGGYDLVAVHDNGSGVLAVDAGLLFTRHATSKLTEADDLLGLTTLGFRGEALASLAAVAETCVRTRSREEVAGTRVGASYGAREVPAPIGRQPGTSVEVWNLFQRHPVRRGAAEPAAEAAAIRRLVAHMALARSDVAFELRVDGRTALHSEVGTLRDVFARVYGDVGHMLDIGPISDSLAVVEGLASGPRAHRGRRDELVLVVNGRLCDVSDVRAAIERAYADVLPKRRYPVAVLRLIVPTMRVDANVHPAKEQVVLRDGRLIAELVERELRALLGRSAYYVSDRRRLALQAADLPALRAAERGDDYVAGGWGAREVAAGTLPRLRLVGQTDDTLIICESELGTLLIDQHRAHERVIFDRLVVGESVAADPPVELCVHPLDAARLRDHADELSGAGWRINIDGDRIVVRAAPIDVEPDDLMAIFYRLTIEDAGTILAEAACHAAIRKRRPLTPAAAFELLEALTACANPVTCPHGQPIVVRLDRGFLERQFEWR